MVSQMTTMTLFLVTAQLAVAVLGSDGTRSDESWARLEDSRYFQQTNQASQVAAESSKNTVSGDSTAKSSVRVRLCGTPSSETLQTQ